MVHHMDDNVGLVHQMPFVCDRDGFPATLEKVKSIPLFIVNRKNRKVYVLKTKIKIQFKFQNYFQFMNCRRFQVYFGTAHARIYLAADLLGVNCPTGMSTLMRKNLIDDAGGLKAFGCYLAEDYFLAKSITDSGWKIRISHQPAWQNSGICEIPAFQARVTRYLITKFWISTLSVFSNHPRFVCFSIQMGETAYCNATNNDPFRASFRVYDARRFGRMGCQLDPRLGCAGFLLGPCSRLVHARLGASFHRSGKEI